MVCSYTIMISLSRVFGTKMRMLSTGHGLISFTLAGEKVPSHTGFTPARFIKKRVRTTKPGWCRLKANWLYPGWIQLAHVLTRFGFMRVQWTSVWATSRRLKWTTTRALVARLSVYSALQRSKYVLDARARSTPFLTQFQPTSNPHTYVGWLNPGSTRFRKKWVECGLAISEFNPGWTRVRMLVRTCLKWAGPTQHGLAWHDVGMLCSCLHCHC